MDAENCNKNRTLAVLVCLLLTVIVVLSSVGFPIGVAVGSDAGAHIQSVQPQVQNNTTVQHENPESVDKEGNLSALEGWLSDRLSQSLINCTQGLKVGQYNVCNSSRGNYPAWLNKYVNVTRETDSEKNRTKSFERAAENQEEYATNVRQFRTILSSYRTARENGNTNRARRFARQLQRISTRVNETGTNLTQAYRGISNVTEQNISSAITTTNVISRNITETANAIEIQQFVNTTIVANASSRQFSFRRPLQVSGQLRAANGTPLANRSIHLEAKNRLRLTTTTNATGAFTFRYRPTTLPLNTTQITVRYAPSTLSVYRGNETIIPVRVNQVKPQLVATRRPASVQFNETLVVNGRVSVEDRGVRSVPVSVSIDGQPLTPLQNRAVRTNAEGRFRFVTRLPADVPTGEQVVRVSVPLKNRAIARTAVTKSITVVRTPTRLSVNGTQISVNGSSIDGPELRVSGRLTTANGTPIRGKSVAIRLNGTTVETARTNENGNYQTNVTVPQQLFADRSGEITVSLVASYNTSDSNLASARAERRLTLVLPSVPPAGLIEQLLNVLGAMPLVFWLGVGGLVLSGCVGAYRYRDRSSDDQSRTSDDESPMDGGDNEPETDNQAPLLSVAREQLFAGNTERAIAAAYADVRARLGNELEYTSPQTHWEFFEMCRRRGLGGERLDALQRLTEMYERAAYAPHSPSEDATTAAIEDARTINRPEQELESPNMASK